MEKTYLEQIEHDGRSNNIRASMNESDKQKESAIQRQKISVMKMDNKALKEPKLLKDGRSILKKCSM